MIMVAQFVGRANNIGGYMITNMRRCGLVFCLTFLFILSLMVANCEKFEADCFYEGGSVTLSEDSHGVMTEAEAESYCQILTTGLECTCHRTF